ncbi:MAG TPA: condensation domain-containing protein, partial [Thermoanaerobaculia bacterium]|nr:condensation domain-containing protein [Thermoanaerobaculia bacterium]
PMLRPFAELVARTPLRPPTLPYLSNLTGDWITAAEATDPGYWVSHLRRPVRFGDGVARLLAEPAMALLEVGPGRTLGSLARRQGTTGAASPLVLASMRHPQDSGGDSSTLLQALGRLWMAGVEVDWRATHGARRLRLSLPAYAFDRRRFWIDRGAAFPVPGRLAAAAPPSFDSGASVAKTEGIEGMDVIVAGPSPSAESSHDRPDLATPYQKPGNAAERRLAEIWQELLGIAAVGVHDNFFELGGHSLLATRVVVHVREAFGRELPLESLFAAPTVARLAAQLEMGEPHADGVPPLLPVTRTELLPLSHAQQRLLVVDVLSQGDTAYNLPLALCLRGGLDRQALSGALERLVRRHESLRTIYGIRDGAAFQRVETEPPPELLRVPLIDLAALPAAVRELEYLRVAEADAGRPIDLFQGPLLRTSLLRLADREHVLLLNVHHITIDGWSWGVLLGELIELYECGDAARLPELTIQYADFAVWQRGWLQGDRLQRQLDYWCRQLAGLPTLDLPTDYPRPAMRTGHGAVLHLSISAEVVEPLRRIGSAEDATLFMTLMTGFLILLHHYTQADDLVVGTDVANRMHPEVEGLIGLFVNQLVLRVDVSGDPTFRQLLQRVRGVSLAAFAHEDAPFDKVVEALNPVRDMSRTPLFQVKLVLQNGPFASRSTRGLEVSVLPLHNGTAKFDLLFNLAEEAGGLAGSLEYSTDLFTASTLKLWLEDLELVLASVVAQPEIGLIEMTELLAARGQEREDRRAQQRRSQALGRIRRKAVTAEMATASSTTEEIA